jgi:hypothetical protein
MNKLFLFIASAFLVSSSFYPRPEIEIKTKPSLKNIVKVETKAVTTENKTLTSTELYKSISFDPNHQLNIEVFEKAYLGFLNLQKAGKLDANAHILSICDFSMSSNTKRLWVIDLNEKKVLFNSLVAHGKNTGEEFATQFSNTESSNQSSLGFYVTENTYNGDNGYSLKLQGMDKGFNDAAMQRAIVMHGADYVSESFANQHQRIGRSWGCPAVPRELASDIINTIKDKTCLFIYYPANSYLSSSEWLKS